ncbi:MAG TPA: CheR family methyltransferase, partial [Longimicrobium sp.]|nr:CheR family methyltransferase [Longimicrobium sp.]
FHGKGTRDAVRVWIAGCATGEQAYSVAILLTEHAATLPHPPSLQMFATDLEETGYVQGRDALYPASSVRELTAERLGRFFFREREGYRVAPPLREAVLFAQHDVLRDAPFARLDLVSCRTLLDGVPAEARARVMGTFHDALVPGGLLFLGAADDVDGDARFVRAAGEHPVYRRAGAPPRRITLDDGSRA